MTLTSLRMPSPKPMPTWSLDLALKPRLELMRNGARRPTMLLPTPVNDLRIDRSMPPTNMIITPGPSLVREPELKRALNSELYHCSCKHESVTGSFLILLVHLVARNGGVGISIDSICSEKMREIEIHILQAIPEVVPSHGICSDCMSCGMYSRYH